MRDDAWELWGANPIPYQAFFRQPQVLQWKWDTEIDLGSSDAPATHWLLIDRETNQAFVAPVQEAHKRVQQQRMEHIE
jgi:hypothetical protein